MSMATGGRLLSGSDTVTDQLLSHVSRHVFPDKRKEFALQQLNFGDAEYQNTVADAESSQLKNYEVSETDLISMMLIIF